MHLRFNRVFCLLAVASTQGGASNLAAEPGDRDTYDRVSEWFSEAWEQSQQFPSFEGFSFLWHTEDHETLPPAELQALRREVAGHPEHPGRVDLPRYERHANGKPTVLRFELFSIGERRWRYNTTFEDGTFNDAVLGGSVAWWRSDRTLKVMEPAEAVGDDPEQSLVIYEREFVSPIGKLMHGYLSVGRTAGLVPGRLVVEGDGWTTQLSSPETIPKDQRLVLDVRGRWDSAARRGFVERVEITRSPVKPETQVRRFEFKNWRRVEALRGWVASRVDEFAPGGGVERSVVFDGIRTLPEGGFSAAVTAPIGGTADVIRGRQSFTYTGDYRNGELLEVGADGQVITYELENGPAEDRRRMRSALRMTGWVMVGAVIITGFLIARFRAEFRN